MGSRERCCFCSVRVPLAPILPGLRAWTIGGGPLEEIAACAVSLGLVVVPFVLFTSVQSSLLQFKFAPARSTIWISPFPSSLQLPPLPPLSTLDGSHGCSIISKAGGPVVGSCSARPLWLNLCRLQSYLLETVI